MLKFAQGLLLLALWSGAAICVAAGEDPTLVGGVSQTPPMSLKETKRKAWLDYTAAVERADLDYQEALSSCNTLSGIAVDRCLSQAAADKKRVVNEAKAFMKQMIADAKAAETPAPADKATVDKSTQKEAVPTVIPQSTKSKTTTTNTKTTK